MLVRYLRLARSSGSWYRKAMKLKLKEIRTAKGVTLQELAARVGMSKSYVSEIENEKKQVNGRRLSAFAAALGVSTHDLIDDPERHVATDLQAHMDTMLRLAPADRAEVERLATFLAARQAGEPS